MGNDINQTIENIIAFYERGGKPQQIMQNMAQGRNPKEFLMQLARQNGVSEKNLQGLSRILGGK